MSLHSVKKEANSDLKSEDRLDEEDFENNLWLDILDQVQECSPKKLACCKRLLVLGDNESGKSSLIAKLETGSEEPRERGRENERKGSALEYNYLLIADEYREDHTKLEVYILDGDEWNRNLLRFVLDERSLPNTIVLLTASMTQPSDIIDSLENWASILEEHILRLRLPESLLNEQRNRVLKKFEDYLEPGAELDGVTSPIRPVNSTAPDTSEIKINLGIEIIVVITKTDFMATLEKEYEFREEHFQYIEVRLRNFCLMYGAALFYVSVKEHKNCDLLLKYLLHRFYGFPFRTPAIVVEKDAVFIPAGWDNKQKMSIIVDNLTSFKVADPYNEVIVKPLNRKPLEREAEIVSEDDQAFLCRLQSLLNQQVPANVGRPVSAQDPPIRTPPGVQKTADRRLSGSPGVQASPKKIEGKAGTVGGGEGVLQNFFNSLLNRRTGSPIGGPLASVRTPGDKTTTRHDAVAELDRMSGRSKKPAGVTPTSEPSFDDSGDNSSLQS